MTAVLIILWAAVIILAITLAVVIAAARTRTHPRFYPPSREAHRAALAARARDARRLM